MIYCADDKRIIIKRVKRANQGADELAAVEQYMNRRIRRNLGLRSVCAQFLGSFEEETAFASRNNATVIRGAFVITSDFSAHESSALFVSERNHSTLEVRGR